MPVVTVDEEPVHFPAEERAEIPEDALRDPEEPALAPGENDERPAEDVANEADAEASEESAEDATELSTEQAAIEPTQDSAESTADGPAPLMASVPSDAVDDSPLETTSEMVGQLWTAHDSSPAFEAWEPDAMDKTISSARGFRWTSVVAALSIVALIVVGLVLLPSIARSRADSHREMLNSALGDLRAELPDTQASLATATEPTVDVADLSGLATQLTVLTARASAVETASQADLPSAPPFTSSQPIDDLEPIQQRVAPLGSVAQTIQRRIANLVDYRTLIDAFLAIPELPNVADPAKQAELRVILASAQADSASILGNLPGDESLAPHTDLARGINEAFADWQLDYLEALRNEDGTAAALLIAGLKDDLQRLDSELVTPLAQIRRQTDTDLIDLAQAIDEVATLISETPVANS